ncbi:MAG: YkgJ family cysteine cluster protein [Saprospiraceae bacterium]|nr:YkgJ family cysteine cluster protein [Saprospiraceae bacterium]MCF8249960.1 YkgJ family cysteine cluster protein [Saprospiraceae bacterium]MCF8279000.1 YkgJ family cysteine cluster protein [Bacteroidales bacterium]MCF8310973.1 YkgJ family cysteine cluster protein [Saprospiraceae bacterium]MCF8439691.1 YkgJ family cysteine cluster protein [Saprospiraceae bacterium]
MPSPLIEDWKRKKEKASTENREIIKRLSRKKGKQLDVLADEVHDAVFKKIDCLDCAGCCTGIPPIVTKADVTRISRDFNMKPADFERQHLTEDEDGDTVMNATPCPFLLNDNKCSIYEIRPKACRQYPHTNYLDFSKNMRLHLPNASVCPAVFYILREIEKRLEK